MTYLEIVIQERSTDGRSILTHRHFHIETPQAGTRAAALARRMDDIIAAGAYDGHASDPLRPCSICWQITQEEKHDTRRSKKTPTR